ncbi:YCII-related domain protein [compost metagenome]
MFATDKPEMADVRKRVRPAHRAYLREATSHGVFVKLGGPTLDAGEEGMNGTLLVVEADCIDDVLAFVSSDPYACANLFDRVEVRPWEWTLGNPEQPV